MKKKLPREVIEIKKLKSVPNVCRQNLREVWKSKALSIAHVTMRRKNASILHKHHTFTELYYILQGKGRMWLGKREFPVHAGMLVVVKPKVPHKLKNTGDIELQHLVISDPPFNPKDIILLEESS